MSSLNSKASSECRAPVQTCPAFLDLAVLVYMLVEHTQSIFRGLKYNLLCTNCIKCKALHCIAPQVVFCAD